MPGFVKTPRDEELWDKAKQLAAERDHEEDWPYITSIFRRMRGLRKSGRLDRIVAPILVFASNEALDKSQVRAHMRTVSGKAVQVRAYQRRDAEKRSAEPQTTKPRPWQKLFPPTDDTEAAGFITPDGQWLSLAHYEGEAEPPYGDVRTVHHAEAARLIMGEAPFASPEEAEAWFADEDPADVNRALYDTTGILRILAVGDKVGVNIRPGMSDAQQRSVLRFVSEHEPTRVDMDVFDKRGQLVDTVTLAYDRVSFARAFRRAVAVAEGEEASSARSDEALEKAGAWAPRAPGSFRVPRRTRVGQDYGREQAPPAARPTPPGGGLSYPDAVRRHWGQEPKQVQYGAPAAQAGARAAAPAAASARPASPQDKERQDLAAKIIDAYGAKHGMSPQQVMGQFAARREARAKQLERPGAQGPGPRFGDPSQIIGERRGEAPAAKQTAPRVRNYQHDNWRHGGRDHGAITFRRTDFGSGHMQIEAFAGGGPDGHGARRLGVFSTTNAAQKAGGYGAWFRDIANKASLGRDVGRTGGIRERIGEGVKKVEGLGQKRGRVLSTEQRQAGLERMRRAGISPTKSQQHLTLSLHKPGLGGWRG